IAQLRKLAGNNEARNRNAAILDEELAKLPFLRVRRAGPEVERDVHVCGYEFDADSAGIPRSLFVSALRAEGIPVGTGYPRCMHEHPLFQKQIAYGKAGCPFTCSGRTIPAYRT